MTTNFIKYLVEKTLKERPLLRDVDIYSRIKGMSRPNFYRHLSDARSVSPEGWVRFRKALKMGKKEFWLEAMKFFDGND